MTIQIQTDIPYHFRSLFEKYEEKALLEGNHADSESFGLLRQKIERALNEELEEKNSNLTDRDRQLSELRRKLQD